MSKFAVLTPAYNASKTILETLESIASQTVIDRIDRIILADDCSTDHTLAIVEEFSQRTALPIEIWRAERNGGERVVVNRSFAQLEGEGISWCFVLHADDVAKPHWLETIFGDLANASNDTASICSSWDDWYADRIVPGEEFPERETVIIEGSLEAAENTLLRGCWWHFSGCAMNLSQFRKIGGFCEDMPQLGDLEWLIRCSLAGSSIRYLPRTLIRYRQSVGNVSSISYRTNRDLKEAIKIADRHRGNLHLKNAILMFERRTLTRAIRRAAISAIKCQFSRAFSASKCAWRLCNSPRG